MDSRRGEPLRWVICPLQGRFYARKCTQGQSPGLFYFALTGHIMANSVAIFNTMLKHRKGGPNGRGREGPDRGA